MRRLGLVIFIVYVIIGVFVARSDGYFKGVDDLQSIVSAVLAVLLWPLVLLGVELNIGGADKKGADKKKGGGDKGKGVLIPLALWRVKQHARKLTQRVSTTRDAASGPDRAEHRGLVKDL